MNLAYFLPLGGSFDSLRRTGQDKRFLEGELGFYLQKFEKIYIFDYSNIKYETNNKKIIQICNSSNLHRFIYALIFPIVNRSIIKSCEIIRVSHLTGMIAGIFAKLLFDKKIVFNYAYDYADFAWHEKKYVRGLLLMLLSRLSFYFSGGIIIASKTYFNKINNKDKRKFIWIPNGVDIDKFKKKPQPKSSNFYKILFIGRLTEQKNILNLVSAINTVGNPKIKLTIIGQGELKEKILSLVKKHKINIDLFDKISNEKLADYYQECDLFVLPSLREGSSKVLLEGMSAGSICLVSRIPENTEIVKDGINGFVSGFSSQELANKIKYIMSSNNRLKISENARKTIEENYSMEKVLRREVDFVESKIN